MLLLSSSVGLSMELVLLRMSVSTAAVDRTVLVGWRVGSVGWAVVSKWLVLSLLVVLGEIVVVGNRVFQSGGKVMVMELAKTRSISVEIRTFFDRGMVGVVVVLAVVLAPAVLVVLGEIVVVENRELELGGTFVLGMFKSRIS